MTREYKSEVRQQRAAANRSAILSAATVMFTQVGWTATTMAGVADAAGVSRQTVYQGYDGKLALLDACIVNALAGEDGARVRDQPEFTRMAEGSRIARLRAGARWLRAAHERSAAIQHVLDQAAVTDADAAARLAERETMRRREVAHAASLILGHAPSAAAADGLWMLASRNCWLSLTGRAGWDGDSWEVWFIATAKATLAL